MTAKTTTRTKGRTASPRCYVKGCGGASRPGHFATATHLEALRKAQAPRGGPADEKRLYHMPSAAREEAYWLEEERRAESQRGDEVAWLIAHGPLPELPSVYDGGMAKITLRDAAGRLGVQPNTLRMAIVRGRMVGHKLGRDWLVEESEVRHYEMVSLGRVGWPKGRRRKSA